MASATVDGIVWLWGAETGTLAGKFEGHSRLINAVTFSLNSKPIASTSDDRTFRLWDAALA